MVNFDLKENILNTQKKFNTKNEKYKIFPKELIDFLGDDFFLAPASTHKNLHNAYPGGLVDHIFTITKYAVSINNLLPENERVDINSLIKVCFLHQIGKTFLYVMCESQWHRDNQGKMYDYNEDIVAMRIGERSVFYCVKHCVDLTEEEYQSIINYDKPEDDKQSRWHSETLSVILRQANELAIIEEKNRDIWKT